VTGPAHPLLLKNKVGRPPVCPISAISDRWRSWGWNLLS